VFITRDLSLSYAITALTCVVLFSCNLLFTPWYYPWIAFWAKT
jgi:hypothetical protein